MKARIRRTSLQLFHKALKEFRDKRSFAFALKLQKYYGRFVLKKLPEWENISYHEASFIGGIDVSFHNRTGIAGIVIFDKYRNIIEKQYVTGEIVFPYIPGLLSFREIEIILPLFEKLQNMPDLVFVDGQGIAHPRFSGIAVHLGLLTGIPAIGVGKTRLVGEHAPLTLKKGKKEKLIYGGYQVGWALCTKDKTGPVFVSPGWKVGFEESYKLTLSFSKYRIPEPTRQAHIFVGAVKKLHFRN